ncbi:MAG: hypothetical protein ACLSDQ_05630 [Adlercreutzia equolifaciens]
MDSVAAPYASDTGALPPETAERARRGRAHHGRHVRAATGARAHHSVQETIEEGLALERAPST